MIKPGTAPTWESLSFRVLTGPPSGNRRVAGLRRFDLARAASPAPGRPAGQQVRPGVQRILDSMTTTPAYVQNGRLDSLAANRLGQALLEAAGVSLGPAIGAPALAPG